MHIAAQHPKAGCHRGGKERPQDTSRGQPHGDRTDHGDRMQVDAVADDAWNQNVVFQLLDQKVDADGDQSKPQVVETQLAHDIAALDHGHDHSRDHGEDRAQIGHHFEQAGQNRKDQSAWHPDQPQRQIGRQPYCDTQDQLATQKGLPDTADPTQQIGQFGTVRRRKEVVDVGSDARGIDGHVEAQKKNHQRSQKARKDTAHHADPNVEGAPHDGGRRAQQILNVIENVVDRGDKLHLLGIGLKPPHKLAQRDRIAQQHNLCWQAAYGRIQPIQHRTGSAGHVKIGQRAQLVDQCRHKNDRKQ